MTAPFNTIYSDGGAQVIADGLNTFVQSMTNVAAARGFIGTAGMIIALHGLVSPGDGGSGLFYWNASGTAADDGGLTTIVPSGSAAGEWTRLAILPAAAHVVNNVTTVFGAFSSITPLMEGLGASITPQRTGIVRFHGQGYVANDTASDSVNIIVRAGLGNAPAHLGGVPVGAITLGNTFMNNNTTSQNIKFPFNIVGGATLTIGLPYWIDYSVNVAGVGNALLASTGFVIDELLG